MEVKMEWKEKNKKYLSAMQRFLDKADNIKEEGLKQEIIAQVLKCDNILTELAIEEINRNKNAINDK